MTKYPGVKIVKVYKRAVFYGAWFISLVTPITFAQETKRCLSSMIDYFTVNSSPEAKARASKFMKIQSEITMNRLLYVYLEGAKKKIKTSYKVDSTEFGIKLSIISLMKDRTEFADEFKKFNQAPISTKSLSQVLPAISNLMSSQEEARAKALSDPLSDPEAFRKDLILNEIDVKLLSHLSGGDQDHPILRYAHLINSKVIDKKVDAKSLVAALQKLSNDQESLMKQSDLLIKTAMEGVPDCNGLSNCSEMTSLLKSSDFLGPVMDALYRSVKLNSSDLPDLFKEAPRPIVQNPSKPRKPPPLALTTKAPFVSGINISEKLVRSGENKRESCFRIRTELLRLKPNFETACAYQAPTYRLAFGGSATREEAQKDNEAFKNMNDIPVAYREYTIIIGNEHRNWNFSNPGSGDHR